MGVPYALKYRPRTFSDVVGQKHVKVVLQKMVADGDVQPAMIFAGSRGTGKTTTARILAAALNCASPAAGEPCNACPACSSVRAMSSTSVLEIDAASSGGVGDVRQIRELCSYAHEGEWRVILLDEAHSMTREAFNALLKTLEEPPPRTVFILLTTEHERIAPTIRSRSMLFDFRRFGPEMLESRLRHVARSEGLDVEDSLLAEIAAVVDGGMRDALMVLEQAARTGVRDGAGFLEVFGYPDDSLDLLEAAAAGRDADGYGIVERWFYRSGDAQGLVGGLVRAVRDLIVLKAGGAVHSRSPGEAARKESLAGRLERRQLVALCRVLWSLQDRTRVASADQRSAMDLAYALILDILSGGAQAPILQEKAASRPAAMSLADMRRAMAGG